MVALVHILQFIVYPQKTRVTTFILVSIPVRILYTIYGVWNLDFFRTVILPEVVCLEMSTMQLIVLALDYLVHSTLSFSGFNCMLETSGLLSGCGNLCNTASLVVVLELQIIYH